MLFVHPSQAACELLSHFFPLSFVEAAAIVDRLVSGEVPAGKCPKQDFQDAHGMLGGPAGLCKHRVANE